MQTFVPFADLAESARVLDQKRLGKQRVETHQVLQALAQARLICTGEEIYVPTRGRNAGKPTKRRYPLPREQWHIVDTKVGWDSHKVTNMWRGHELGLLLYQAAVCQEWTSRGYKDTCLEKSTLIYNHLVEREFGTITAGRTILERVHAGTLKVTWPAWLGDERVHASHRAALLWKAPEHYSAFGWTEEPEYNYYWPV